MRSLLLILMSFLLAEYGYSANISTTVDRDPVSLDESFEIIFEADASPDGEPDFSSLAENVQILSRRRSNSTSIINGRITRSQKWILTVIAKKTGLLHIPAINFGSDKSEAIVVEVVTARRTTPGRDPVFIELDIDNKTPYVQAQALCTVRLYLATSFSNASLSEPKSDVGMAIVKKIGEDKNYQLQRGQQLYQVVERQYAIYPQKSGLMTIEPILFQGQTGSSRFFDLLKSRTVIKKSDDIVLNVKPIPAAFPGQHWLPAIDVNVSEQWSINPVRLKQGEPVTRTLTVAAQGLLASQLPEVSTDLDLRLKNYPDRPVLNDTIDKHGFLGIRIQKLAIVPAHADTFSLPAIRIPWWNTLTDELEYAELPPREIIVVPVAPAVAAPSPPVQQQDNLPAVDTPVPHAPKTFWKEAFFIALFIWLVSLLLFISRRIKIRSKPAKGQQCQQSISDAINAVRRACKENDRRAVNQALLYWGRLYWPQNPATSLDEIGRRCDVELGQLIAQLDQLLYGGQSVSWEGNVLLNAFERHMRKGKKDCKNSMSKLEPLHYL